MDTKTLPAETSVKDVLSLIKFLSDLKILIQVLLRVHMASRSTLTAQRSSLRITCQHLSFDFHARVWCHNPANFL